MPLEVIVRNLSAGSFAKRYGVEEGIAFAEPTLEFSYKNDDLGDPLLNASHALALGLAGDEGRIAQIEQMARKVNELLKARFAARTSRWSTSSWSLAACRTARSCSPTRSRPTPALLGFHDA